MYIKRERFLSRIRPFFDVDLIKVVTGVRRCGKSILLQQIETEIRESGVSESHLIRINFEDIQFEKLRNYKKLNQFIMNQMKDDSKYYIFLDEIQHVLNFEKTLSSLRATRNCSIFITGSNSKLLSGKMASLLVGRCIEFRIMPFSFAESYEFLKMNGKLINPDELIFDYINWGGFPLRFSFSSERDIKSYLQQTYDGIINRDIITEKSKIDREKFLKVSSYVMANAGKEFSGQSISKCFESMNSSELDKKLIYRYLDKMEKACLINRVKRFNIVGKKAMAYLEKQYSVDSGFSILNTNFVNFEDGVFLENIIYNELVSRGYEVFTGKTYKGEVDFVVLDGKKKCFIQAAYYLSRQDTIKREFEAFAPISDAAPKYVLSLDRFDYSRDGIAHINVVDFLLGKKDIVLN
jgi:predicted AAA+ superfamily ATPase